MHRQRPRGPAAAAIVVITAGFLGTPVSRDQLQPGDLRFFRSPTSHEAMYVGNGQIVQASTYGQPVNVVTLDSMPGYNNARRVV